MALEVCAGSGTALHWQRSCISYSLVERRRARPDFEDVRDAVDRAFQTWSAVQCDGAPVDLSLGQTEALSRCETPQHASRGGNTNSIIFVEDWAERGLPSDAFGLTLIWHSPESGEIFDADMQVNETMGELTICDGRCAAGQVDLENVVTHEAGHFLGLGHTPIPTAAMYGESRAGEIRKRYLNDDDRAGICAIFGGNAGHTCSDTEFQPIGGLDPECYVPEDGGCSASAGGTSGLAPGLVLIALLTLRARRRLSRP